MKPGSYVRLFFCAFLLLILLLLAFKLNAPSNVLYKLNPSKEDLINNVEDGLEQLAKEIDSSYMQRVKDKNRKHELLELNKSLTGMTSIVNEETDKVDIDTIQNLGSILNKISLLSEKEFAFYHDKSMKMLDARIRSLLSSINEISDRVA